MKFIKSKIFYFSIILLIVIILLISNLGQSFKSDIFSYDDISSNYNTFQSLWNNSSLYQDYIDKSSNYIESTLKEYNVVPIKNKSYISSKTIYVPVYNYSSTLEVISTYGKIVKSYEYNSDFVEDLRGNITSGYVKSKTTNLEKFTATPKVLNEIVLLDNYDYTDNNNILDIDNNLKYYGAAAIISPEQGQNLKNESGINGVLYPSNKNGLVKFLVTKKIYQELKVYGDKGYTIRMKSGVNIQKSDIKNICGIIKGKSNFYKPLVYICFYDGEYKNIIDKNQNVSKYMITPSIVLDTVRSIYYQRTKPSRDIIFIFLSGYPQNKLSLNDIEQFTNSDNIIFLDLFGTTHNIDISYNNNYNLLKSIKEAANISSFNIQSSVLNKNTKYISVSSSSSFKNYIDNFQLLFKSNKLLLTIIDDECYNIDYFSDKFRFIKSAKKIIKSNSALLSILTIILMIIVVFKKAPSKKSQN